MSPSPAVGPSRRHLDPPTIEPLVRKRQAFVASLDVLATEVSGLNKRRDDAASHALNGGGSRAEKEYKKLVATLAKKAERKQQLKHAIASLDNQIADERQRLEADKRAVKLAEARRIRASEIRNYIANLRRHLDGYPGERRIGPNGEEIISRGRGPEPHSLQREIWEREVAKLQKELDDGMPDLKLPGDGIAWKTIGGKGA